MVLVIKDVVCVCLSHFFMKGVYCTLCLTDSRHDHIHLLVNHKGIEGWVSLGVSTCESVCFQSVVMWASDCLCEGSQANSHWTQASVPVWTLSYDVWPQDWPQVPRHETAYKRQTAAVSQVRQGVSWSLYIQGMTTVLCSSYLVISESI